MKILVLSTWFPYPTNQGSKTRAYHLIKALAKEHQVALISFEDVPIQPEWITLMQQYVERIETLPKNPFNYSRLRTWMGFLSTKPSAVVAGYSKEMENLVKNTAEEWKPDMVFAFTFVTAPYARKVQNAVSIVDVDNLLAIMLHEYFLEAKQFPQRVRRFLAYQKLRAYESQIYRDFDRCLVVSDKDRERIKQYIPLEDDQILCVSNGVSIDESLKDIYPKRKQHLIYNGALTYHPNFDAMMYFLQDIFPMIQSEYPNIQLQITGRTKGVPIHELPTNPNVHFTGYLDDIRPAVASSTVCIVPLRQGAGTRLKILEAMALGTAVVSTSKGAEGLDIKDGIHYLSGDSPIEFGESVIRLIREPELREEIQRNAFELVKKRYDWSIIEENFSENVGDLLAQKIGEK